jgi:tetratricopeptide (TPR) repeat protein
MLDGIEAGIELLAGDPKRAETVLRASCERLREMSAYAALATRAAQLAEALYQQDEYEEAREWTVISERYSGPHDIGAQLSWRGVRAKALARGGEVEVGEELARRGLDLAARTDALNQHAKALVDLAEVLQAGGRPLEARTEVEQALELYERKGNLPDAARAKKLLQTLGREPAGPGQKARSRAFRAL